MAQQPPPPQGGYPPPQQPAPPPQPYAPPQQQYAPPQQAWVAPVAGPAPGVNYASAGARLIAYLIDGFIMSIVFFVVTMVLGGVMAAGASSDSGAIAGLGFLLWVVVLLVVSLAYFPFFWARGGATPGMKLLHIRIVRELDGGPLTASQAILRLIGYWVSAFVFYIGFIWILIDAHKQGWHDKIANTVVIESR